MDLNSSQSCDQLLEFHDMKSEEISEAETRPVPVDEARNDAEQEPQPQLAVVENLAEGMNDCRLDSVEFPTISQKRNTQEWLFPSYKDAPVSPMSDMTTGLTFRPASTAMPMKLSSEVNDSVDDSIVNRDRAVSNVTVPEIVAKITRAKSFAPLRYSNSLAENLVYEVFFDRNMPMWGKTLESWNVLNKADSDSLLTATAKEHIKAGLLPKIGREEWWEMWRLHCKNSLFYVIRSVDIILRGVGQVYVCNHPITGLCICIGLFITSPTLCAFAIAGTIGSTLSGFLLVSPDWQEISNGLFGYDGTLIGAAVHVFFSLDNASIVEPSLSNNGILIVALLSVVGGVFHGSAMNMNGMPALTLAFNMVMVFYIMIVAQGMTTTVTLKSMVSTTDDGADNGAVQSVQWEVISLGFVVDAVLRGVGQFCFVGDTIGSLVVLIGILICSRKAAFMALIGSAAGLITSRYVLSIPASLSGAVRMGLYSYNSMGAAVAVAGDVFFEFRYSSIIIAIFTSILVVLIQLFMEATFSSIAGTSFPSLTVPFVITTWMVMLSNTKRLVSMVAGEDLDMAMLRNKDHSDKDAIYLHAPPEGYETYSRPAEANNNVESLS